MTGSVQLAKAIRKANRVYLCGNGGSAANAIHIANDLISVGVKAIPLTADIATLTAIANDYGYQHIFSKQIALLGEKDDLLVALSGSGNSPNVLAAITMAYRKEMQRWAVFGAYFKPSSTVYVDGIIRRGKTMQEAEEAQLKIGHEVMKWLKAHS